MTALTDRIAEVLQAELDEHGHEDDDEKRWQVAWHMAERVAAELHLAEEWSVRFTNRDDGSVSVGIGTDQSPSEDTLERTREFWPGREWVSRWVSKWLPVDA